MKYLAEYRSRVSLLLKELELEVIRDQADEAGNSCFYVGRRPEIAAGLYGFSASPSFLSEEELVKWVIVNEKKLIEGRGGNSL